MTSEKPRRASNNQGSHARDHLANERTFLAWVRTALGLAGLGVLLAKLVDSEGIMAEVAGLAMIAFGAGSLVYGAVRYDRVRRLLDEGWFAAASVGPLIVAALSLVVVVVAVVLVLL